MRISPLLSITSAGLCSALALPNPLSLVDSLSVHLLTGKRQTLKPANAPTINKYVALGNSYSAGNNAGKSIPGSINGHDCRRYDGSYASQLQRDKGIMDNTSPGFQFSFLACSGFTTPQISASEITDPSFINGADLYTVTSGGNDVGFTKVVSHASTTPSDPANPEAPTHKPSSAPTPSNPTSKRSTQPFKQKASMRTSARPGIVIALPYVRFFNTAPSATSCLFRGSAPVDISTRKALNDLTDQLNLALRTAAIAAGIQFLDSDYLQTAFNGHRFCESVLGADLWFQGILRYDPGLDNALDNNRTLSDQQLNGLVDDNGPDSALAGGTFHPTVAGHAAYENVLKAQIIAENRV